LADKAPLLFRNAYIGVNDDVNEELSSAAQDRLSSRNFDFLGHLAFTTVFSNMKHDTIVGMLLVPLNDIVC
jgi:hypothetical protein